MCVCVCTYLFCGHTRRLLQPKLPPHSDLKGTAAPQADGSKYTSSERGHKTEERTHLSQPGPSQAGQGEEKDEETSLTLATTVFIAFLINAFIISLIRHPANKRRAVLYIREFTLNPAWNP